MWREKGIQQDIDLTEYVPHAQQVKAHASKAKFLLFGGAVGGGKSVFLVQDALRNSLAWNGNDVGIYRWELSSFKQTTFKTLERWVLGVPGLVEQHNQQDRWIRLYNGSIIRYGGLKPSESAAGDIQKLAKSLEHSTIYLDELTDFPEKVYRFLPSRIGRVEAVWALTGEKDRPPGRIRTSSNPEPGWVKREFIDEPGPLTEFVRSRICDNWMHLAPDYESTLRSEWGDNDDWAARYIDGDWSAVMAFDAVLPEALLLKAIARGRTMAPGEVVEYGLDVGAEGDDPSVLYRRRGWKADRLFSVRESDTMKMKTMVAMLADRDKPRLIKIDAIGIGKGVCDQLAAEGYPVMPIVGGERAREEGFLNVRAEIYWGFRKLLEEGKPGLPDDKDLLAQAASVKYLISASDRAIQIEAKKNIKKRLGRSPDDADALIYAFAYAEGGFTSVLV